MNGGLLAAIKLSLRVVGLQRTLRFVRRFAERPVHARKAEIDRVLRAVSVAASMYPGRARCLEQSILLYLCLRRAGHAAALQFGVQPRPFRAHCWVTVDGEPVGETDGIRRFVPLPDLLYE